MDIRPHLASPASWIAALAICLVSLGYCKADVVIPFWSDRPCDKTWFRWWIPSSWVGPVSGAVYTDEPAQFYVVGTVGPRSNNIWLVYFSAQPYYNKPGGTNMTIGALPVPPLDQPHYLDPPPLYSPVGVSDDNMWWRAYVPPFNLDRWNYGTLRFWYEGRVAGTLEVPFGYSEVTRITSVDDLQLIRLFSATNSPYRFFVEFNGCIPLNFELQAQLVRHFKKQGRWVTRVLRTRPVQGWWGEHDRYFPGKSGTVYLFIPANQIREPFSNGKRPNSLRIWPLQGDGSPNQRPRYVSLPYN